MINIFNIFKRKKESTTVNKKLNRHNNNRNLMSEANNIIKTKELYNQSITNNINNVREEINLEIKDNLINNTEYRLLIKNKLTKKLPNMFIICDETNNTYDVIDSKIIIARVYWCEHKHNYYQKYIDISFGKNI